MPSTGCSDGAHMTNLDHEALLNLAYESLHGLSVGDALGAQYFVPGNRVADLEAGRTPAPPWPWTDDTEMACTVVAQLRDRRLSAEGVGSVGQDELVLLFAERCESYRGYGPGSVVALHAVRDGRPWREVAAALFDGAGSCGNGAAMRVAPVGAYFHQDLDAVAGVARATAEVTHAHPEGIAGAVAVAVAAAVAVQARLAERPPQAADLLEAVADALDDGATRRSVVRAIRLAEVDVAEAAYELGNGSQSTAQDSVPLALWAAARHLDDYRAAVTAVIEAGGDVDTTAAMTGGVVAAYTGVEGSTTTGCTGVPRHWLAAREPLPDWAGRRPSV